jgi:hypothetical protein
MRGWWNWNTRQVENLVGREAHAGSNPALRTSSLESRSLTDCADCRPTYRIEDLNTFSLN